MDFFGITSSKFNKKNLFQSHFEDNFDGFYIMKIKNFITHRIEIKIIWAIIEKQMVPQFWTVVYMGHSTGDLPPTFFLRENFIFRSLLKNIWYVFFHFNVIYKISEKWIFENYRVKKSDRLNFFISKKVFIKKIPNISPNMRLIPNFEITCTEKLFQWIFINKLAIFINK